jgi:hypothetical protein
MSIAYWNYFPDLTLNTTSQAFTVPALPGREPESSPFCYGPPNSANQTHNIWVASAAGIQNHPTLPPGLLRPRNAGFHE